MINRIGLLIASLALAACSPAPTKWNAAELDGILTASVEQKAVPGVVAMVADAKGVVYERAVGLDKATIFAIASMTKPVTSVAVMQLVEVGKVKLDDPAETYLPELAKTQVLDGGKLRPPKNPITVRQLLTHTSGFGYEFMNRQVAEYVAQGKVPTIMAGGDGFLKAPLLFDPGTRWEYGISTDWLGKLVEKVSGESLEQYFQKNIFEPLEMKDSHFNVPPEKQSRLASLYQRKEDGSMEKQSGPPVKPSEFLSGGGGLYSTAGDYMKFIRALMAAGQPILKPETVAAMGQNQIGDLALRPFSSLAPMLAKDGGILPDQLDKFGLGFALNTRPVENGRGANALTWAGIFNTFFWIDREKKVCAVLMTQMSPGLDDGPRMLLERFNRAVYAIAGGKPSAR